MHGGKSTSGGARIPLITRSRMMNVLRLVCGLVSRLLSAVSRSHRCWHGERVGLTPPTGGDRRLADGEARLMEEAYFSCRKGGSAVFRRAPRAWGALPSGNTGLTGVVKDAHYGPPRLTGSLMDLCGRHCLKMCTCWLKQNLYDG